MKTLTILAFAAAAIAAPAHAGYTQYTGDAGGFVPNTATSDYLAAQGSPSEFISFNTLADGTTAPSSGLIDGSLFSTHVSFASEGSPFVNYSGSGDGSEIGPSDQGFYDGTLVITLANDARAVGFGPVENADITFFDQNGNSIQSYSSTGFGFVGLVGDSGSLIRSVRLTGTFFAIQDFQYATAAMSAVPEPASWAMMIGGIGLTGAAMRRRQRVRVTYA